LHFFDQRWVWRATRRVESCQFLDTTLYLAHVPALLFAKGAYHRPFHFLTGALEGIKQIAGQTERGALQQKDKKQHNRGHSSKGWHG
jgi:hypothetical protein